VAGRNDDADGLRVLGIARFYNASTERLQPQYSTHWTVIIWEISRERTFFRYIRGFAAYLQKDKHHKSVNTVSNTHT